MFEFGDLDRDAFFRTYWRKKPLFIKGGARFLFDREMKAVEFRQIVDRMMRARPALVNRRPECIFAQNMNVGSVDLARRASAFERATSCAQVWFDGVLALQDEGIGSHFDHSDNFVLQQSGTKHWRLCSPHAFSDDAIRNRMLEVPEAGLIDMPADSLEFTVEAGDLLYIPLFWGHCGRSVGGRSLSLSLVFNAANALDVIVPLLKPLLEEQEVWWRPMPVLPLQNAEGPPSAFRAHLEELATSLAQQRLPDGAVDRLWSLFVADRNSSKA